MKELEVVSKINQEREARLRNVETIVEVTAKTLASVVINIDKLSEQNTITRENFAKIHAQSGLIAAVCSTVVGLIIAGGGWFIAWYTHKPI